MYSLIQKKAILFLSVFYIILNMYHKKWIPIIIFILGAVLLSLFFKNVMNCIIISYIGCVIYSIVKNFHLLENFEEQPIEKDKKQDKDKILDDNQLSDRLLEKYISKTKEKEPRSSFTRQVKITDLIPSQSELNHDKLKIMKNKTELHYIPIVISNDNFIIDGHYRWKINQNNNKEFITAIIINTTINKFLKAINKFKKETNIDELSRFTIDKEKINKAKDAIKNIMENAKLLNEYQKDLDKINVV